MRKKFLFLSKTGLCMVLASILTLCPFSVSAANAEEMEGMVRIIETAGMNGYYSYNAKTGEEVFVPASDYAPLSMGEDLSVAEEQGDPDILDNELTEYYEDEEILRNGDDSSLIEPFSIIGDDNRTPVTNVEGQYVNTCLLVARYSNGEKDYCTGFVLDDYHVLTVGHIAYHQEYGYADHFAVYAGSSNGKYKQYSLAYTWDIGGDYIKNPKDELSEDGLTIDAAYSTKGIYDDWAIIECETALGVGHLGRKATNSASSMGTGTYYTNGYPRDKNEAIFGDNPFYENLIRYYMYTAPGQITRDMVGPQSARYLDLVAMNFDVKPGQSGSPIYRYESGLGYCARAMIVAGDDANQLTGGGYENYAILINDWLYSVIQSL